MHHSERTKDALLHVIIKWDTRDDFNQAAGERRSSIRVVDLFSGGEGATRTVLRKEILKGEQVLRAICGHADKIIINTACMRQQVGDRHRRRIIIFELKAFEVGVDIRISVELPLLYELHDGSRGYELGDGCRVEDSLFWYDGRSLSVICVTISFLEENLIVFHQDESSI